MDTKFHPDLLAHFAAKREEQQHYVQTAMVARTVRSTRDAALALLDKYVERGVQMDESAVRADAVMRESELFAQEAQGASRFFCCFCVPRWWFECK